MRVLLFMSLIFMAAGCARGIKKTEGQGGSVVRTADLKKIFIYISRSDPEYTALRQRMSGRNQEVAEINSEETGMEPAVDAGMEPAEDEKLLHEQEQKIKARIYELIHTAVKSYAAKNGIDIIINVSDGALYSAPGYDVTDGVLMEISVIQNRSKPMVR